MSITIENVSAAHIRSCPFASRPITRSRCDDHTDVASRQPSTELLLLLSVLWLSLQQYCNELEPTRQNAEYFCTCTAGTFQQSLSKLKVRKWQQVWKCCMSILRLKVSAHCNAVQCFVSIQHSWQKHTPVVTENSHKKTWFRPKTIAFRPLYRQPPYHSTLPPVGPLCTQDTH